MPAFLRDLGAVLAAHALKLVLAVAAAAALLGGGFVWGDNHATAIALKSAGAQANARVAAAQKQDRDVIASYLNQINDQKTRGDMLAASLAQSEKHLAAAAVAARKEIAHAVPQNPACDLSSAAIGLLNAQPARH